MNVEIDYSIIDIFGKRLQEGKISKDHSPRATLQLQDYQNGNYFIHLKPENSRGITQKIVLMRDY